MRDFAVEHGTGDALLVFGHNRMGAGTGFLGIAVMATRARVHGGNQLKVRREGERAFGAADGDHLVFHRLAHDFQHAVAKLRELAQEQDAPVR
jgi:hypothetical protein